MDYYRIIITSLQKWGISESSALAYGSTLLISLAPFLLLFLVRVENTPQHRNYLRIALSFASGGLLGDAFLHLIPHSMGHSSHSHEHEHGHEHEHKHDHDHDHKDHHPHEHHNHDDHGHGHSHLEQTYVGLYIVSGIVIFFLLEKFIHFLKGGDAHSHSHGSHVTKEKLSSSEDESEHEKLVKKKHNKKTQKKRKVQTVSHTRLVSGLLNLIADFLHNFTDGLAIGATFATGNTMGTITAFTIFVHEIPHEIGDYAILIQAGYKRRSAMALQLVTAIGALIGTAVGLQYGTLEYATQLILPVTAGGFIYIATVSVIPDLLEKTTSYLQTLAEIVAMITGLAMMFWIALNE